jgi:hypothetical protein
MTVKSFKEFLKEVDNPYEWEIPDDDYWKKNPDYSLPRQERDNKHRINNLLWWIFHFCSYGSGADCQSLYDACQEGNADACAQMEEIANELSDLCPECDWDWLKPWEDDYWNEPHEPKDPSTIPWVPVKNGDGDIQMSSPFTNEP